MSVASLGSANMNHTWQDKAKLKYSQMERAFAKLSILLRFAVWISKTLFFPQSHFFIQEITVRSWELFRDWLYLAWRGSVRRRMRIRFDTFDARSSEPIPDPPYRNLSHTVTRSLTNDRWPIDDDARVQRGPAETRQLRQRIVQRAWRPADGWRGFVGNLEVSSGEHERRRESDHDNGLV